MKVEPALFLGPARRKRGTLAAERCKTGVAVIKQSLVVGESTAAQEVKVGVLRIGTLPRKQFVYNLFIYNALSTITGTCPGLYRAHRRAASDGFGVTVRRELLDGTWRGPQ